MNKYRKYKELIKIKMSNILKLIYLISLILYSLCTDCSGLNQTKCEEASSDCTFTQTAAAKCEGSGCSLVTGTTTCQTSNGCNYEDPVEASCTGEDCALNSEHTACVKTEDCSFTEASEAKCTGTGCTVSGTGCVTSNGCSYVAPVGTCSAKAGPENPEVVPPTPDSGPSTFTTITIKLISVSGNNIVISITPDDEIEKEYKTSAKAIISGLSLVDSGSFNQELKCEISSGYKLSSSICTIQTAASDGNKYKLSGTPSITSSGNDDFGTVSIDSTIEVIATTINDDDDNSFKFKRSFMIFLFLFLF